MYPLDYLRYREADQVVSIIANIAPFLCGLIVPLNKLPHVIRVISFVFPFSWALDLIRYYSGLDTYLAIKVEWLIMLTMMIIYYVLGMIIYKKLSTQARLTGSFSGY